MRRTPGAKCAAAALAGLMLGMAACGEDGNQATTAPAAAKGTQRTPAPDLDRFLMRKGEEPGFRPGAAPGAMPRTRETITGVKAFAKDLGLAPAEEQRLSRAGFISFTVAPIRGPQSAGLSNVALFETAEGAEESITHDAEPPPDLKNVRRFTVPGIPAAQGWTASVPGAPKGDGVGNVFWVQGRCVLGLGNQGPGPFVGPLSKGVRAIYERTNGECP